MWEGPCEIVGVEPNAEDLTLLGAVESLCTRWVIVSSFYVERFYGISVLLYESNQGVFRIKRDHRWDIIYCSSLCHWWELGGWVDKGMEYGVVELVEVLAR